MDRVLIIGTGNMGAAILRQGLEKKVFLPGNLSVYDKDGAKTAACSGPGIEVLSNLDDVSDFQTIILAVKPVDTEGVLATVSRSLGPQTRIISVAAGLPLSFLRKKLGKGNPLARIMPNINAISGAGMSAACFEKNTDEDFKHSVIRIFSALGETITVDEAKMDAVTGLSGSGPAFVFMFVSSLVDGGIKSGLSYAEALTLALHTVEGSVRTILATNEHPDALKDKVASPAGTTIEGIHVLEKRGFRSCVMEAVEAAAKRSTQLGEKFS